MPDDQVLDEIRTSKTPQGAQYRKLLQDRENETSSFLAREIPSSSFLKGLNEKISTFESEALKDARAKSALSVGDIIGDRSALLRKLRDATSRDNNANVARIFQRLEGSLLNDLEGVPGNAASTARTFSRTLNDFFTRNFVNDILMFDRTGGARVSPELVLSQAFTGQPNQVKLNFQQMEDAVNMLPGMYDEAFMLGGPGSKERLAAITPKILADSADRVVSFNDAASRYLRLLV
ncbi:MAG: hypothetical protein ACKO87_15500, partial [Dolichospermum sp.]